MAPFYLTRKEFAEAIDREHAAEKEELLARFDLGQTRHRAPLDLLDGRNWVREREEELLDARVYEIFEKIRRKVENGRRPTRPRLGDPECN